MKTFKTLFALLIFISILSGCRKDSISTEVEMNPPTPQTNTETTFNGFVTDTNGAPVADATVSILNAITQTNEFGFFEITGLANEKYAVLEVEKIGYFDQFETLTPSNTAKNRTRIKLIEKNSSGSFSATSGGTIPIGTESSVEFQANSFIDSEGNVYNGEVTVYSFFIDPTDEDIDQIMPGNLMAVNADEELNILQSFGMVNVELEGENGQKLNINQAATLTVDVPSSLTSDAPNEIPLWYFDENSGLWKEEGSATLQNGKYVGTVNHFTFWNCDVPGDFTSISGQIFDENGISIMRVRITNLSTGASYTSWTDSEGNFAGAVPQNENLLLEVLGFCGEEILFSADIGPFSEDEVDLGTYSILNNNTFSLITGTLVDCDLIPLDNGQVYFTVPNQSFIQQTLTDANGNFSALVPTCDMEEIEIKGVNLTDGLISQTITIVPSNPLELGIVEVCADISSSLGSVLISYDGQERTYDNCTVEITIDGDTTRYLFIYDDVFPNNDTLRYFWSLTNFDDEFNNPQWSDFFGYGPPASADDVLHTVFTPFYQEGVTNITVNQEATNSGDLMQITFDNIRIGKRVKDPNATNTYDTFNGSTINIIAVLQ